jgi:hypothetical protein
MSEQDGEIKITVCNVRLHWTGSSRFSLVSIVTSLAAVPGQRALCYA